MYNFIPSIGESFNARSTATSDLCNGFIVSDHYSQICSSDHLIMVGPRGSGKTTLLRMLELQSLDYWEGDSSVFYRENINFSGVFIPTDRFWKTQYDRVEQCESFAESKQYLEALFIYHILECFCNVVSYRANRVQKKNNKFRHVDIPKSEEVALVRTLSDYWCVTPSIPTLKGLIIALTLKKSELSEYISKAFNGVEIKKPVIFNVNITDMICNSVSIVNTLFDQSNEKWAFLFDELELAPNDLIQPLVDAMRGGGNKDVIFKLALSPYHEGVKVTRNPDSAMKDQDIKFVDLTGNSDQLTFAEQLCSGVFKRKGLTKDVGLYFESPAEIDINIDVQELIIKDPSFNEYLTKVVGTFSSYQDLDSKNKDLLRKIKFITHLRNHLKGPKNQIKARRRPADFYAGFKNICKEVEYNPRMLIGIMNIFSSIAKSDSTISINDQINKLEEYFSSFRALLSTIDLNGKGLAFRNIYELVEHLSKFYKNEIYSEDFKDKPRGSFLMKSQENIDIRSAVGLALNSGALITVGSNLGTFYSTETEGDLRFRVSYLFSHHFNLLLTLQKEVELLYVLSGTSNSGKSQEQLRIDGV